MERLLERLRLFLLKLQRVSMLIAVLTCDLFGNIVNSTVGGGTVGLVLGCIVGILDATFVILLIDGVPAYMQWRRANKEVTSSSE